LKEAGIPSQVFGSQLGSVMLQRKLTKEMYMQGLSRIEVENADIDKAKKHGVWLEELICVDSQYGLQAAQGRRHQEPEPR